MGSAGLLLAALAIATPEQGWHSAALGLDALSRGELEAAVRHLRAAQLELRDSEIIARDLALALAQAGDLQGAQVELQRAKALGHPDLALEEAIIAGGIPKGGALENLTVAAIRGDRGAVRDLGRRLDEGGGDASLVRLVLARDAALQGDPGRARALAELARRGAETDGDALVYNAARDLEARLEPFLAPQFDLRAGVLGGVIANPQWGAARGGASEAAASASLRLEGAVSSRWGPLEATGVARLEQRGVLERSGDRTALELAGLLELPFSADLDSARFGVSLRLTDVRSGLLEARLASGLSGGPHLRIALSPRWWGELALHGVWTDFGDSGPAGFNRDRIGQRVTLSVQHLARAWSAHLAFHGLNDESVSDVFDALGGGFSARLRLLAGRRWELEAGIQTMLRRFGPVGDENVIGGASRRLEFRWGVDFRVRRPWAGPLFVLFEGAVVRNEARSAHRYGGGRLGLGLEGQW